MWIGYLIRWIIMSFRKVIISNIVIVTSLYDPIPSNNKTLKAFSNFVMFAIILFYATANLV